MKAHGEGQWDEWPGPAVEAGLVQRTRVLEKLLADVYGPQTLLHQGFLPAALIQGHPGYLREMHGVQPIGGNFLHLVAFDLMRGPDGLWWLAGQHTQNPSGHGQLPALFESLTAHNPAGSNAHTVLLTPGPGSDTYWEDADLARHQGFTLVQGDDLTVRGQHLFLKTKGGLQPVHGLIKRVDDEDLDPLELRPDSNLGVPGLLLVIRAGHVTVANFPGSAFLESPALLGFLPALAQHLIGETLQLPAVPTWWCGEPAVLNQALAALPESVIQPTYPRASFTPVAGQHLSAAERTTWAERIQRQPDEHTLQSASHLAQPSTLVRVFVARARNNTWRVQASSLGA